jgi:PAT family beta-lactamase induction signal transducer AmpG
MQAAEPSQVLAPALLLSQQIQEALAQPDLAVLGGGLGVSTMQVGVINGTVGMIALTVGGLLGGIVVAKYGFKKTLWPLVICMHTPILLYVWAAYTRPHLAAVYGVVAVDNFGYGFGLAAYMVYLMLVSQTTKYKTSHYAISTGIMALGAMGAGIASGYLQEWLGYARFFVACTLCTIPATLVLFFIPMYDNTPDDEAPKDTLEEAAVTES